MRDYVTENLGALVDADTADRITFDFNPETFKDSKSSELAEINIPGMSHPRLQFSNGSTRTISFSISLHYGATEDVPKAIHLLQSWLYPEYDGGHLNKPPAKLLLIFGDTWPNEKWVMRSCNITHRKFDKLLNTIFAVADIELAEFISQSRGADEVRA